MAPISRGPPGTRSNNIQKAFKARKSKKSTPSSRQHHFTSFSERIANLHIDPVRRTRRNVADETLDTTTTFFKTSFDEWKESNLSATFVAFAREVQTLTESLPQILHHSDRIHSILIAYIEKHNVHSLEPLLSLTAHFAHDLGARFEPYFESTVFAIVKLAAKHESVEVIEWSFTCLAWLFKFLSRLLVPDLRPLYRAIAPLLGKERQKGFVSRFAAEGMSFLIRRAASQWHKHPIYLHWIVEEVFNDLSRSVGEGKDTELYELGIMTLFAESIKGVQHGLHSAGSVVFEVLLHVAQQPLNWDCAAINRVLQGLLINVVHHTNSDSIKPIIDVILKEDALAKEFHEDAASHSSDTQAVGTIFEPMQMMLIYTVVGTRKGTRIADWSKIMGTTLKLAQKEELVIKKRGYDAQSYRAALVPALAVVTQYAPLDISLGWSKKLLGNLLSKEWKTHFLHYCNRVADIGTERFKSLVLPHFRNFIITHWEQSPHELATMVQRLRIKDCLTDGFMLPLPWQEYTVDKLSAMLESGEHRISTQALPEANVYLDLLSCIGVESRFREQAADALLRTVTSYLAGSWLPIMDPLSTSFLLGPGLRFAVEYAPQGTLDRSLWPLLCNHCLQFQRCPAAWEAIYRFLRRLSGIDYDDLATERMINVLIKNLGSPSGTLRLWGLRILDVLYAIKQGCSSDALLTAVSISEMPVSVQTARTLSMHVRKLGSSQNSYINHPWLKSAVPNFCFGLLHVRLASLWDDACMVLKELCSSRENEDIIVSLALEWLNTPQTDFEHPTASSTLDSLKQVSTTNDFQCTNLLWLDVLAQDSCSVVERTENDLQRLLEAAVNLEPLWDPSNRSKALQVLQSIPQHAEKRSRALVPIILRWASSADDEPDLALSDTLTLDSDDPDEDRLGPTLGRWSRKDQKALLSIFASFANPRVLHKSTALYDALLVLLSNGDIEIQKSALQAVCSWKSPSIKPYEENLNNLLDEKRFREEISVFLDIGNGTIRPEHRQDLMPVLLHLLYGKVVTRTSSAGRAQEGRRKAVFVALSRFGLTELRQFLEIVLGPLKDLSTTDDTGKFNDLIGTAELVPFRKQFGTLRMIEDMVETLGSQLSPFTDSLATAVMHCLLQATHSLEPGSNAATAENKGASLLRSIRQIGFRALNSIFKIAPEWQHWRLLVQPMFSDLIVPRLQKLPVETAQSVSGLLQLFSTWSRSLHTALFLVEYDSDLLEKLAECLTVPNAKDEVVIFVLNDILKNLIGLLANDNAMLDEAQEARSRVKKAILEGYSKAFLTKLNVVLRGNPSQDVLEVSISAVSALAPFAVGDVEAESMIEISTMLLRQPNKRVNPRVKGNLLQILGSFIPRANLQQQGQQIFEKVHDTLSNLFGFFKDEQNRQTLAGVFMSLAGDDEVLSESAQLCRELNALSAGRLNEIDFERRSKAFSMINEELYPSLSLIQWRPLIHNMLFFIRDTEELAMRTNASYALRRFVEAAASRPSPENDALRELVGSAVLPSIYTGVRKSPSELVRVEYLSVIAHITSHFPNWPPVSDLVCLLAEGDEEASFFTNILHIQQHRRLRALRRLAGEAEAGKFGSHSASHFLVPLVEHFIFEEKEDESAHNLAAEAVRTTGTLSESLEWPQWRAKVRYYMSEINHEGQEKTVVRLLSAFVDGLSKAAEAKGLIKVRTSNLGQAEIIDEPAPHDRRSTLSSTIPSGEKLSNELRRLLIEPMLEYLHKKDESTVSLRVPIATSLVKLLLLLPPAEMSSSLTSVLVDVCHILRSRDQGSRDMTRKTLADMAGLLGPPYFGFILRELRSALQRGYQLHVLSFTVHSILISIISNLKPGDIDYCLPDIVSIVMDDIFGVTGQEKEAEEYISKMKEVKSSKSFDSMELIARIATLGHLVQLIKPIQALLQEKLSLKMVKKIDELLRRIGLGVMHNDGVGNRGILVFCYEIVQEVYRLDSQVAKDTQKTDYKTQKYLIASSKSASRNAERGTTSSFSFKLTRFAFDVMRSVLQKREDLQTPENLVGFLPILGDALVQGQEEVQQSALRALTTIVKVPLAQYEANAPVYVSEAVRILRGAPSTNTEVAQAALKFIAAMLREKRTTNVKENDLAYLLKRLKPDLEEPDRQGITFNFLKAVLGRKIVIPEVYNVLDSVATIAVTNQTRSAREAARSVYFQFLVEYPQGKDRFTKSMGFLVKNLEYEYPEGRQSVMELVHLLIGKVGDDLVPEIAGVFFVPLVMGMVNDEDAQCREMAGLLVKKCFERAEGETLKIFLGLMRTWLDQDDQLLLTRVALHCYMLYFEVKQQRSKELGFVLEGINTALSRNTGSDTLEWERIYYALQTFAKICQLFPETAFSSAQAPLWYRVLSFLDYRHMWVKVSASRLLGTLFSELASNNADRGFSAVPLVGRGGIKLNADDMCYVLRLSLRTLEVPTLLKEDLANQVVRNLAFLGRCFAVNRVQYRVTTKALRADSAASVGQQHNEGEEDQQRPREPSPSEDHPRQRSALNHLIWRSCGVLRKESEALTTSALLAKNSALTLIAALISHLEVSTYKDMLSAILHPLQLLTDPSIPSPKSNDPAITEKYSVLVDGAQELITLLQKRVGTTEFVKVLGEVRDKMKGKREERRGQRAVKRVAEPEEWGKLKKKKVERDKEKRKEKSAVQAGRRRGW